MKKRNIFVLLLMLCFLVPLFTACGPSPNNNNPNNNNPNNSQTENEATIKFEVDYIKNLQLTETNGTAYGIKISSIEDEHNVAQTSSKQFADISFIQLNNIVSAKNENHHSEKYYLYSTSQTYENGNVEYDSNSITKVTFKKNTTVTEDVYDNNGNLIDSNTTINQEDIPAQINKLYVSGKYIFMQFIPIVFESKTYNYYEGETIKSEYLEVRPSSLVYDLNGISDFDTKNYYSSALSQSFVIDSQTGYIYKIENFKIASIVDSDLVKDDSNNIYKMTINDDGILTFKDILPNKDIAFGNAVTDKYGYTFVYNGNLDLVDHENKIIYCTGKNESCYVIDENKNIYIATYDPGTLMFGLRQVFVNGTPQTVDEQLTCYGLKSIRAASSSYGDYDLGYLIGYYKGKRIYSHVDYGECIEDSFKLNDGTGHVFPYSHWFDRESIVCIKDNILFIYIVDFEACYNQSKSIDIPDFTKLSDDLLFEYTGDYYINVGNDKKLIDNVFYKTTLTGTTYYQLVRNGNKFDLIQLEDKSYEQNVFIFQPINK